MKKFATLSLSLSLSPWRSVLVLLIGNDSNYTDRASDNKSE